MYESHIKIRDNNIFLRSETEIALFRNIKNIINELIKEANVLIITKELKKKNYYISKEIKIKIFNIGR